MNPGPAVDPPDEVSVVGVNGEVEESVAGGAVLGADGFDGELLTGAGGDRSADAEMLCTHPSFAVGLERMLGADSAPCSAVGPFVTAYARLRSVAEHKAVSNAGVRGYRV